MKKKKSQKSKYSHKHNKHPKLNKLHLKMLQNKTKSQNNTQKTLPKKNLKHQKNNLKAKKVNTLIFLKNLTMMLTTNKSQKSNKHLTQLPVILLYKFLSTLLKLKKFLLKTIKKILRSFIFNLLNLNYLN